MTMAAIFALLISSGACSESHFATPDGMVLAVLTCPRLVVPQEAPPGPPPKRT